MDADIIIIGGGIAGLSTAYRLQQQGYKTILFEKHHTAGGRARTYCYEDNCVDMSAQFLASFYKETFKLLDQLGMENDKSPLSKGNAIIKGDQAHSLQPVGLLFGNLIPFWGKVKLSWTMLKTLWNSKKLDVDDITKSIAFDNQSAAAYANKNLGRKTAVNLIASILRGFFFWNSETTSKSLLFFLLRYSPTMKLFKLKHGIGSIATTLASQLDVRLNHDVISAEVDPGSGRWLVTVSDEGEEKQLTAKAVLSAIPAPGINSIFPNLPPLLRDYFGNITFTDNATVHLFFNRRYDILPYAHLFFVPDDVPDIAAVVLQNNKGLHFRLKNEELTIISVFPSDKFSEKLMDLPEKDVVDLILSHIEKQYPFQKFPFKETLVHAKVVRVRKALPRFPEGYIHTLKKYQDELSKHQPPGLFFAGDFLETPSIEGAVMSGLNVLPFIVSYLEQFAEAEAGVLVV